MKLTEKVDHSRRKKEVAEVKKQLRKICDMAKEEGGLEKGCDYIEHVLKKDYDSLDYFDEE